MIFRVVLPCLTKGSGQDLFLLNRIIFVDIYKNSIENQELLCDMVIIMKKNLIEPLVVKQVDIMFSCLIVRSVIFNNSLLFDS